MDRERYITAIIAEYNRHRRRIGIEDRTISAYHAFMCNAIQAHIRRGSKDVQRRFDEEADSGGHKMTFNEFCTLAGILGDREPFHAFALTVGATPRTRHGWDVIWQMFAEQRISFATFCEEMAIDDELFRLFVHPFPRDDDEWIYQRQTWLHKWGEFDDWGRCAVIWMQDAADDTERCALP